MTKLPLIVTVQGHINECTTTLSNELYCKYIFSYGKDWSIGQGSIEGVTQVVKRGSDNSCVFNFPISVSFQSSQPFGWPQILIAIYGHNLFGNEMVVGYGASHIPLQPGHHEINIPLFVPASASMMQTIIGFFTGVSPEYVDLKFIANGANREVTKTKSQGQISVTFNVLMHGLQALELSVT
ncbi:B9 domain-containing protein 1 [Histomonas meleagridis]|uniref:B9 domain-containing protein 1 n=1 Tax=Histomonas meleagridis TaxID=135588 RepID=UPI00355966CC|nr:B9 domain-containing protein 1 [Histomonas meleagridis]KAH0802682.1 B9 domain-containing protein 1 [Histomonas meleagridis]